MKNDMESRLSHQQANPSTDSFEVNRSPEEWRKLLDDEQYRVLREKGTEAPGTGKFLYNKADGVYTCAACGNPLFRSDQKFDSHCGWPSFDDIIKGAVVTKRDVTHGMIRTEILCSKCGSHLGHVFDDGPTETGLRYCVNSLSLGFDEQP